MEIESFRHRLFGIVAVSGTDFDAVHKFAMVHCRRPTVSAVLAAQIFAERDKTSCSSDPPGSSRTMLHGHRLLYLSQHRPACVLSGPMAAITCYDCGVGIPPEAQTAKQILTHASVGRLKAASPTVLLLQFLVAVSVPRLQGIPTLSSEPCKGEPKAEDCRETARLRSLKLAN